MRCDETYKRYIFEASYLYIPYRELDASAGDWRDSISHEIGNEVEMRHES